MSDAFEGWWSDGRTAVRRRVRLARIGGLLLLHDAETGTQVARLGLADLRLTEEVYRGQPLRLAHSDWPDAALTVEDHRLIEWLGADAPRLRRRYLARHGTHWRFVVWGGALVFVVALVILAVPRLTARLAPVVPVAWAETLGDATLDTLTGVYPACHAPGAEAALEKLVTKLAAGAETPYRFTVRVLDSPVANAAAAAGGRIVVFSGLLALMETPEELAAVLAHEVAHGVQRHPLRKLLRHMGYRIALATVIGDATVGMELVAGAARLLLESSYSRADEAAADRLAMTLLHRAGIDSRGAARFFRRVAEQQGRATVPALLSSHPGIPERIAAAEARQRPGTPALTPSAWQAVRTMCAGRPAS